MQTGIVQPSGPSSHFWISFGSVWARYTASGGAANRLVTTTWVLPSVFRVNLLIVFLLFFYLRGFDAGENVIQPVVVLLQRFSQHCQPLVHCFNAGLCETTRAPRAIHATCNNSCVFEHLQVLGDCRLRHLEGLGQFHHSRFALGETCKNCPTRWIGQS